MGFMIHACQPPLDDAPCSIGSGVVAYPRRGCWCRSTAASTPGLEDRGTKLTLLIAVDDATGTVAEAVLRAGENTGATWCSWKAWSGGGAVHALPPLLACTVGRKSPPRASSKGVVYWRRTGRRPCPHCGKPH